MGLPLLVEFFQDLQHVRGRSLNTVMAYRRDLDIFSEFKELRRPIVQFYEYMKTRQLSSRSQARVISSVRTYFKFCEGSGLSCPELIELRPPKIKAALPKTLSLDEFERLISSCEGGDPSRSSRNKITLLLLFGLGCRVSELISLNLEDFSSTDRVLKITGKGSKERLIPLTDQLAEHLISYLKEFRSHLIRGERTQSLLINDRGHRPSRVDIWRWLAAWSTKAGFDECVSPHRFRHACATSLLEGGADLRSIQMLLGHSSIQTTQIYTNVTSQNLIRTVEEHHPLSNLKEPDPSVS